MTGIEALLGHSSFSNAKETRAKQSAEVTSITRKRNWNCSCAGTQLKILMETEDSLVSTRESDFRLEKCLN